MVGGVFEYKGFEGSKEYSSEDGCHFGKLLHIRDLVTYESDSVSNLEKEFQLAVDDYLDFIDEYRS